MTKPKAKASEVRPWSVACLGAALVGAFSLGWLVHDLLIGQYREVTVTRTVTAPQDCPLTEKQAREVLGLEGK